MTTPLLQTKLFVPPPRPALVPRPRLVGRLEESLHRKLTLISAPAGFGKTTLLSEWIAGCEPRTRFAWLSLDEGDNDLVRFLTYVIAALQTVKVDIGQGLLAALQSPGPVNTEAVLTTLINESASLAYNPSSTNAAHSRSEEGIALVLDDYHVIESPAIDQALAFLLDHMPPSPGGVHLIIATRTDPALGLSRLRARGQLTELRAGDLRFTVSEAADFLNKVVRLPVSTDHVRALEDRTEGWITGLQLAAVAMQGLDRHDQIADFVDSFGGSHRHVIDYLVDEVLDRQPPHLQAFLLQTSILDRMVASLCNAVTGREDSQAILEQLESANLFLIPLDGKRRWYRYHHLFADLLRQRLRQSQPPSASSPSRGAPAYASVHRASPRMEGTEGSGPVRPDPVKLVAQLHVRASEWYARHSFQSEAVHHALAGGDFERAAGLIQASGLRLIGQGAFTTVRNWIDALPSSLVRKRPCLCVYHAWASNFTRQLPAIAPRLRDAERALRAQSPLTDDAATRDLRGHISTLRAWNARRQRDNALAIDLLRDAIDCLEGDSNSFVRTFAELNLGLAYLDDGELVKAADAFRNAVAEGSVSGNELASLAATSSLAAVLILQGRLHESAKLCRRTIRDQLERHKRPPPTLCMVYLRLAWVLAEWGDIDGYYAKLSQAVILADQIGYDSVVRAGSWSMAWEKQVQAEQGTVIELSKDVAPIIDRVLSADPDASGMSHSSDSDIDISAIETQNTEVYLADDGYFEVWPGYSNHARARKLVQEGRPEEALDLLTQITESARVVEGIGLIIEAWAARAMIYQAQGDLDRALHALKEALSLGESEGYVRTFADRGVPMAQLLQKAAARGIMPDYASRVLAAFGTQAEQSAMPVASQPLIEPLTKRELEILRLVAQGLSNREIGEQLFLALSTVKGHNRNIYGKLQVRRRTEAIARARELGLI